MAEKVSRLFALTCELGGALGWENISMQRGCQEHTIDAQWWFAINPHDEPNRCSRGAKVPPQSIYYEFNGWPAGCVTSSGGLLAAGKGANEESLTAAIEAALEQMGAPRW